MPPKRVIKPAAPQHQPQPHHPQQQPQQHHNLQWTQPPQTPMGSDQMHLSQHHHQQHHHHPSHQPHHVPDMDMGFHQPAPYPPQPHQSQHHQPQHQVPAPPSPHMQQQPQLQRTASTHRPQQQQMPPFEPAVAADDIDARTAAALMSPPQTAVSRETAQATSDPVAPTAEMPAISGPGVGRTVSRKRGRAGGPKPVAAAEETAPAAPAEVATEPVDGGTEVKESPAPKKTRTNTPWTPAEEQRLKAMRDQGKSWGEIAKTFPARTEGSVKKHWYKDMHYAEFGEDEVRRPFTTRKAPPASASASATAGLPTDDNHTDAEAPIQHAALLAAIKEYDSNKWKVVGAKLGKPAKACEAYAKEHFGIGRN